MKRVRSRPQPSRTDVHRLRGMAATFGAALRREREARRISQDVAATAAGTWQAQLSRLERGHVGSVSFATVLRLIHRCGLRFELAPRDPAIIWYREESERRRAPQLDLLQEARAEFQRAIGAARSA